jgi:hypothetical protein
MVDPLSKKSLEPIKFRFPSVTLDRIMAAPSQTKFRNLGQIGQTSVWHICLHTRILQIGSLDWHTSHTRELKGGGGGEIRSKEAPLI